jgi:hypothetical protein
MKTFIVDLWSIVFQSLRWVSLFEPLRRIFPALKTEGAVDGWALSNFVLAILAATAAPFVTCLWGKVFLVGYSLLRVFEIAIYQINVLIFDGYRAQKENKLYKLRGYRRLVVLLLQNYTEIVFWFAAIYVALSTNFDFRIQDTANSFFGGIYSSFIVMTTFGDPNVVPKNLWAASLILYQSVIGLFMTLLSLARFIAFIPKPKSSDELESESSDEFEK